MAADPFDFPDPTPQPRRPEHSSAGLVVGLLLLVVATAAVGIYLYRHDAGRKTAPAPDVADQPAVAEKEKTRPATARAVPRDEGKLTVPKPEPAAKPKTRDDVLKEVDEAVKRLAEAARREQAERMPLLNASEKIQVRHWLEEVATKGVAGASEAGPMLEDLGLPVTALYHCAAAAHRHPEYEEFARLTWFDSPEMHQAGTHIRLMARWTSLDLAGRLLALRAARRFQSSGLSSLQAGGREELEAAGAGPFLRHNTRP